MRCRRDLAAVLLVAFACGGNVAWAQMPTQREMEDAMRTLRKQLEKLTPEQRKMLDESYQQMQAQPAPAQPSEGPSSSAGPKRDTAPVKLEPRRPNASSPGIAATPRESVRSYFDEYVFDVQPTLNGFLQRNRGRVGGAARLVSTATALATARSLLGRDPEAVLRRARALPGAKTPAALGPTMIGLLTHKRTVEALAVALAVHAMDPASPTALFNVATLLYTLGRPNEALALYDELQRRRQAPSSTWWKDPTNALDYSRALALLGSGRAATARPLLERIVAAEPHLSEAALALALLDAEEKRNPRRNFVLGSWRTRAAPMVCGGTGNNGSSATDPFESGEQLALPFETILDFGRGSGGVLPAVPLASSVYMPSTLLQRIEERKRREAAEMQSLREQKRTLYGRSSGV